MSGLSAGTIEPPNRPSRKRRATEWANKVIQNHILTETGDREIHSNPIIISDSTRSQFILEAAKYLVDNMPEGAEFFEQKRNALRTIVRLKAFDNGDSIAQGLTNSKEFLKTSGQPTNTGMKEKQGHLLESLVV